MTPNRRQFLRSSLALTLSAALPASAAADADALDRGSDIAYRRVLEAAKGERRANADASTALRMRRIGNRLVAAAVAIVPDAREYAWAFNLLGEAAPDVRVFPGGRTFVTDALVARSGFNDAEIGAIIAHALAHAILGHDLSRYRPAIAQKVDSPDANRQALDAADATLDVLKGLRYEPAEIQAADRTSVEMLWRAVYDPRAASSAWRRLAAGDRGIVERAPVDDGRLAALDAAVRGSIAHYEEARAKAEENARSEEERRRQLFMKSQRERGQSLPPHLDPSPRR
jgi:predicted Zn-dependent protease